MSQILDKFIKSTILYQFHVADIHKTIDFIETAPYERAIIEITSPGLVNRYVEHNENHRKFTRCDLMLDSTNWYKNIIFKLSTEINCDSQDVGHMKRSRKILQQELSWSHHLRSQTCVMLQLPADDTANLSRDLLTQITDKGTVIIELPIVERKAFSEANKRSMDGINIETASTNIWKRWNKFHMNGRFRRNLKLALELTPQMPTGQQLKRWFSEPVEYLILSSESLKTINGHGLDILPDIKMCCLEFMKRNPIQIILKCPAGRFEDASNLLNAFKQIFVREIQSFHECKNVIVAQIPDTSEHLIDFNRCTLFMEMLLSKYKEAIQLAIADRLKAKNIETLNIMLCGAHAFELLPCISIEHANYFIYEENVNVRKEMLELIPAYLKANVRIISNGNINELHGKMDLIVAFTPELINQGILTQLNFDLVAKYADSNTILIPNRSKLFVRPVMSSKVLAEMQDETYYFRHFERNRNTHDAGTRKQAICITSIRHICECSDEKEFLNFKYSMEKLSAIEINQFQKLSFIIEQDCCVTGFAGYFEAYLYNGIQINGRSVNDGNRNCYPIMYMPLISPQQLYGGTLLQTNFWFVYNEMKRIFWYQWCTSSPHITHIHNVQGVSSQWNYFR